MKQTLLIFTFVFCISNTYGQFTLADTLNDEGVNLMKLDSYEEAIPVLKKALKINPGQEVARVNLARCYYETKKYPDALKTFYPLLNSTSLLYNATQEIGLCHYNLKNFDSAASYFKKAILQDKNDILNYNNLGAVFMNKKDYVKSIQYFKQALEIDPKNLNSLTNLGRAYFFNKQYELAIATFNNEINIDETNGSRDLPYIALSYEKLKNKAMAQKYEAKAREIYPDFHLTY